MLINSRIVGGRCPVCGAVDCACGGPSGVQGVDERVTRAVSSGPLLTFELGRGVSVRLREETARRQGLLPPKPEPQVKKRTTPQGTGTKIRRPGSTK
jgi:hypothetical protein